MKFNPNEYETVKSRKERFYKDHEDGRIIVELINQDHLEYACFKASVFMNQLDQEKQCPRGVGYALEIRDTKKSISNSGAEYESVNYTSWTENCEESAVGRALDNAGYSGNKKASREEMEKAQRMSNIGTKSTTTGSTVTAKPTAELWCDYHKCKMFQTPNMKSPAHKDDKRGWCNGRGYQDEIEAHKAKVYGERKVVADLPADVH